MRASWYLARLAAMPRGELAHRAGLWFVARRRRATARDALAAAPPPPPTPVLQKPLEVRFFDFTLPFPGDESIDWSRDYHSGVTAPMIFAGDINYRDPRQVGDIKNVWELNRHQFLAPWALDYAWSGNEDLAAAAAHVISDWIARNPPHAGVNWCSALEAALRTMSWGIALDLIADSPHARRVRPLAADSVEEQARFIRGTLSLYSSANNHLIGELTGLLAAAAFFPERGALAGHAAFARSALPEEALRQNLPDGVNREQAAYYHYYVAEYLLTAAALWRRLGWGTAPFEEPLLRKMLEFADALVDNAGAPFEIGDTDDGAVTGLNLGTGVGPWESLLWSGAELFGEPRLAGHAARIARSRGAGPAPDAKTVYWFGASGIAVGAQPAAPAQTWRRVFRGGGWFLANHGDMSVCFKAGPFGYPSIAAHAHCDQLSVCLRERGGDILADCGTFAYHGDEEWRRHFKGTAAHNTVRVDGKDQAEYAGPFLWATRADGALEMEEDSLDAYRVCGHHDGYRRLPDPVSHERTVEWRRGLGFRVTDALEGHRGHRFELFWNLGAGIRAEETAHGQAGCAGAWRLASARGTTPLLLAVRCSAAATARTVTGGGTGGAFVSRRFGEKTPITRIEVSAEAERIEFETTILPLETDYGSGAETVAAGWRAATAHGGAH